MHLRFILCMLICPSLAWAEVADYGDIELNGLSRDVSWPLNEAGEANSLVCNVNGPEGFFAIRSGPGTEHEILIKLERLAYVTIDTGERRGNWVRVVGTSRGWTPEGERTDHKGYGISGWAHDGYLCSYTDYTDWDELYRNRPTRHKGATRMDCEWHEGGDTTPYDFKCEVLPGANGGFRAIANDGYEYVLTVSGTAVGRVETRYNGEVQQDAGTFVRIKTDPDCWAGAGSRLLCARGQAHGDEK